jgi:uncharacterized protein (TIGR03382 family)
VAVESIGMRWAPLVMPLLLGASLTAHAEAELFVHTENELDLLQQVIPDETPASGRAVSRTIYLNRTGITVTPGTSDARTNRSSLVSESSTIPAWSGSEALWSETVTCLRDMYAPFDVAITETDPGDAAHIEAVFGGSGPMLQLPRAGGVSPMSTRCNVVENSIVFIFTEDLPTTSKAMCEVAAQEIAHSYGLDHELLAADPMTYLSYSGKRSFQDTLADCGEVSTRACGVPGHASCRGQQNSVALLLERLGPAQAQADSTTPEASDDPAAIDDAGAGCSASGGSSWLGALLVLGVGWRSRRRCSYCANVSGS